MTSPTMIRIYVVGDDGQLSLREVAQPLDWSEYPHGLTDTGETQRLVGWPDEEARAMTTEAGLRVYVTGQSAIEALRGICYGDRLPGMDLEERINNHSVDEGSVQAWIAAGWVEDRGHRVLTRAGYGAL